MRRESRAQPVEAGQVAHDAEADHDDTENPRPEMMAEGRGQGVTGGFLQNETEQIPAGDRQEEEEQRVLTQRQPEVAMEQLVQRALPAATGTFQTADGMKRALRKEGMFVRIEAEEQKQEHRARTRGQAGI